MLRPVQQDVLSSLMNLGCTFSRALEAVEAVKDSNASESFDQLFRKALDVVNSGTQLSKKAAA